MTSPNAQEIPAVGEIPKGLFKKLLYLTLALIIAPMTVFFLVQGITGSNSVSAGVAVVLANVIVFGYIATIMNSETQEEKQVKTE